MLAPNYAVSSEYLEELTTDYPVHHVLSGSLLRDGAGPRSTLNYAESPTVRDAF